MMNIKDYLSTFQSPQYAAITGRQQPYDINSAVRGLASKAAEQKQLATQEGQWRANVLANEERKDIAQNQANKAALVQGGGLAIKAADLANKYGAFDKVKDYFSPVEVPKTEDVASYFPGPDEEPSLWTSTPQPNEVPWENATPPGVDESMFTASAEVPMEAAGDAAADIGADAATDAAGTAAEVAANIGPQALASAASKGVGMATEELTGSKDAGLAAQGAMQIGTGFALGGPVGGAVGAAKTAWDLLNEYAF